MTPSCGVIAGVRASPAGVRSMLVNPGVPAGAGVAPIGVRSPARRAAMLACACRMTRGSPVRVACIGRRKLAQDKGSQNIEHSCAVLACVHTTS